LKRGFETINNSKYQGNMKKIILLAVFIAATKLISAQDFIDQKKQVVITHFKQQKLIVETLGVGKEKCVQVTIWPGMKGSYNDTVRIRYHYRENGVIYMVSKQFLKSNKREEMILNWLRLKNAVPYGPINCYFKSGQVPIYWGYFIDNGKKEALISPDPGWKVFTLQIMKNKSYDYNVLE
jgi:hypothetical protein